MFSILLSCFFAIWIVSASVIPVSLSGSAVTVKTPFGKAKGVYVNNNVARFSVKYATASRFQPATPLTVWSNVNNDINALPPVCAQPDPSTSSSAFIGVEDCLYAVIYAPLTNGVVASGLPVLVWIHGGSFQVGSATGAGLDATSLAAATNSVVVVIQYRLGALGFLPPPSASGNANLGAKDVLVGLQLIGVVAAHFGGSAGSVTLAGQSSGATLIRGLLAAPSASPYFKQAWLHSDVMGYGFNLVSAQNNLANAFYGNITSCAKTNLACQQNVPLSTIISVQNQIMTDAPTIDVTTSGSEPIRIVTDGTFVTHTLTGNSFPSPLKPVVITTVNEEAGPAIFAAVPQLPSSLWSAVLEGTFTDSQTNDIINSGYYPVSTPDDIRPALVQLGTDQLWRCPSWTMGRAWAQRGGSVYTGVFEVGAVYPDFTSFPFCTSTSVCHEGDIEVVFGTISNPSSAQTAITKETQARYGAFLHSGNPNAAGFSTWTKSTSSNVHALSLGGSGAVPDGGCTPSFFGSEIPYDYQTFNQS